jgi:hypothetical protein
MLSAPTGPGLSTFYGLIVATGALAFGYLIASRLFGKSGDSVLAWALALPCLVGYALILMLAHMATGGWMFSHGWFIRIVTALIALILMVARIRAPSKSDEQATSTRMLWLGFGLVIAALILWSYPTLELFPLHYSPDTRAHMGWANQLLNGLPAPTAALSGEIPNFYPWLFHAFTALVSLFTPGGNPFDALVPVHFLFVAGVVLGLFALGREFGSGPVAPIAAALFGAMTGGFGFIVARGPEIVMSPRREKVLEFWGDLLFLRSYNFAFSNMVPPFPRDLTFALLPVFLLLMIRGVRQGSKLYLVGAGSVLGCMGLAQGGEAFLVAALTAVLVILMTSRGGMPLRLASVLVPAILVYAIWAGPLMINYFRHGGFFDMSRSSLDFPLWSAIASWGIILPFGVYGLVRAFPQTRMRKEVTVLGAFLLSALIGLIGSVVIEAVLGEGFGPLSKRHRYWPILCLSVALFAAVGATDLFERLRRRPRPTRAFLLAAVIVLLAIPSPLLASLAYPEDVTPPVVITESLEGETHTVLNELDTRRGAVCTVAAIGVTDEIFAFTGHRLVAIVLGNNLEDNQARVRWRDIYEVTESLETRFADTKALIRGGENVGQWQELVDKYDVNAVVVPAGLIDSPSFDGLAKVPVPWKSKTVYVVWIDKCQE